MNDADNRRWNRSCKQYGQRYPGGCTGFFRAASIFLRAASHVVIQFLSPLEAIASVSTRTTLWSVIGASPAAVTDEMK